MQQLIAVFISILLINNANSATASHDLTTTSLKNALKTLSAQPKWPANTISYGGPDLSTNDPLEQHPVA